MNCPECGVHATLVGESPAAKMFRCPRGHHIRQPKAEASVRMKVGPVEMESSGTKEQVASAVDLFAQLAEPERDEVYGRGQPPDTSRDRSSYKAPKPFGPESLPAKVLAYLRHAPHRIDHHVAEARWNHTRLAGTIHILRTHGYQFETHLNEGKVAVYELLNPSHRHE